MSGDWPGGYYQYPPMRPVQEPPPSGDGDQRVYPGVAVTVRTAIADGKPVRVSTWGFPDLLLTLLLWFLFSIGASIVYLSVPRSPGWQAAGLLLASVIPWIGMAGFPILITALKGNGLRMDLGLRWSWRDVGIGVLYGLLTLAVAIIMGLATEALFGDFSSAAGDLAEELTSPVALILFAITVGLGAPIVEEICFRGLGLGSLAKRRLPAWLAIVLSALIFALFHLEPVRMGVLFGVGLVLGFARWRTGSTTTSIVAHMTNNFPGFIGVLLLMH